jgi:hypothetical protein
MIRTRVSEYIQKAKPLFLHPTVQSIGLNAVRVLSLVALILVFSSTIMDMNANVIAVNAFGEDYDDSALVDCEYIELSGFLSYCPFFYWLNFSRGSSVPNQLGGAFWAYMASLFIIFQTFILGRQFPSGLLLNPT